MPQLGEEGTFEEAWASTGYQVPEGWIVPLSIEAPREWCQVQVEWGGICVGEKVVVEVWEWKHEGDWSNK